MLHRRGSLPTCLRPYGRIRVCRRLLRPDTATNSRPGSGMPSSEQQEGLPGDAQCRLEVRQSPLDACRQILHRHLTGRAPGGLTGVQWGARDRCCEQLQAVSLGCRCAAIRGMVRGYEQSIMPPLDQGLHSSSPPCMTAAEQRRRCGDERRQGEGGLYGAGETARCLQGGEGLVYGGAAGSRAGPVMYDWGLLEQEPEQKVASVRLIKARQYLAGLPTMCLIEPMECSVFSPGDQH